MKKVNSKTILIKLLKWIKRLVLFFGTIFSLMLILSFTNLPFWGIYKLANYRSNPNFEPNIIVVMSGNGVPSNSALMRTYHAAKASEIFPDATIIIACTETISSKGIEDSTAIKMANELIMRGVTNPILFEKQGTNTRSQALYTSKLIGLNNHKLIIVSAPEHMYRAISSFEKIGFKDVTGWPTFPQDIQISLAFESDKLGGNTLIPDVGNSQKLRYDFWTQLGYQIQLLREYTAITYYKLNNWL